VSARLGKLRKKQARSVTVFLEARTPLAGSVGPDYRAGPPWAGRGKEVAKGGEGRGRRGLRTVSDVPLSGESTRITQR
jgi:hypothetical protein